MKATVALLSLLLATTSAHAKGLSDRAAEIFEQACLSKPVLAISNGSDAGEVALAAKYAGDVFAYFDAKGQAKGLRGTPRYELGSSGTGRFTRYVTSKDLTASDVVKKFKRLTRVASQGSKPTFLGPQNSMTIQIASSKERGRNLKVTAASCSWKPSFSWLSKVPLALFS
ncbi:hypothetical protein KMP13_13405 [Epibacterium ulvae]|uniref:hypothetical protein n=1 Tax=Epibacterium ulvae TaxID=1156985 RepID=UPI001BFCACF2|nr:hypothetical protein [Epibacterium ulvae]MBT8154858.1 hypothetical protein [Epibacterium ulvae]